jgi:hypothetical protein
MNAFCNNCGPGKIGSCTCMYFLRDDMLQVTVVKFMVNLYLTKTKIEKLFVHFGCMMALMPLDLYWISCPLDPFQLARRVCLR